MTTISVIEDTRALAALVRRMKRIPQRKDLREFDNEYWCRLAHRTCFWAWPWGHVWGDYDRDLNEYRRTCEVCGLTKRHSYGGY